MILKGLSKRIVSKLGIEFTLMKGLGDSLFQGILTYDELDQRIHNTKNVEEKA